MTVIGQGFATLPGIIKGNTGCGYLHVNTNTVSEDRDFIGEDILNRGQRCRSKAGIEQCSEQSLRILRSGLYENVEVKRGAGNAVQNRGNATDHNVFYVMLLKGPEYVLQAV